MILVLLLWLTCGLPVVLAKDTTVLRPNYGAAFHRLGGADSGVSFWGNTFAIPWITINRPESHIPECTEQYKDACNPLREMALHLTQQRNNAIDHIEQEMATIKSLIPARMRRSNSNEFGPREKRDMGKSRSKRFNLIGWVASSLFGLATEDETRAISDHVDQIEDAEKLSSEQITHVSGQLSSFINATNDRFANAVAASDNNHKLIKQLEDGIRDLQRADANINDIWKLIIIGIRGLASYTDTVQNLQAESSKWVGGAQTLLEGYLPRVFVTPNMLKTVLQNVAIYLQSHFPAFSLSHSDPGYYYQVRNIRFTQTDRFLYISINIPLKSLTSYFDLYSVILMPVPLNATTTNTSLIVDVLPYFAVSRDNNYYAEIDHNVYASCIGTDVKRCHSMVSMRSRQIPSCVSALYFDRPSQVAVACNLRYQTSSLFEGAVDVGSGYFLASSSASEWSMGCPDKSPLTIPGCVFCVIKLGCGCSLSGDTFFLPPRVDYCHAGGNISFMHPVNLPVLHTLYSKADLKAISGITTYKNPARIKLPTFKLKSDNWSDVIAVDKKFTVDFKKLAANVDTDAKIYKSKADAILDHHPKLDSNYGYSSSSGWAAWIALIISIASMVLSVLVCCRSQGALPIFGAGMLPGIRAYVVVDESIKTIGDWNGTTIVEAPHQVGVDVILFLLIVVGVLALVLRPFLVAFFHRCRHGLPAQCRCGLSEKYPVRLILRIVNGSNVLSLPLMHLASCTSDCLLDVAPPVTVSLSVICCMARLTLVWPREKFVCSKGNAYRLPSQCRIPLNVSLFTVRQLLEVNNEIIVVAVYRNYFVECAHGRPVVVANIVREDEIDNNAILNEVMPLERSNEVVPMDILPPPTPTAPMVLNVEVNDLSTGLQRKSVTRQMYPNLRRY